MVGFGVGNQGLKVWVGKVAGEWTLTRWWVVVGGREKRTLTATGIRGNASNTIILFCTVLVRIHNIPFTSASWRAVEELNTRQVPPFGPSLSLSRKCPPN